MEERAKMRKLEEDSFTSVGNHLLDLAAVQMGTNYIKGGFHPSMRDQQDFRVSAFSSCATGSLADRRVLCIRGI